MGDGLIDYDLSQAHVILGHCKHMFEELPATASLHPGEVAAINPDYIAEVVNSSVTYEMACLLGKLTRKTEVSLDSD